MFMFIEPSGVWPVEQVATVPTSAGSFTADPDMAASGGQGLLAGPVAPILQHLAKQWGWSYQQTGQAFGMPRIAVMADAHMARLAAAMNAQMRGTAEVLMNPRTKTIVLHFGPSVGSVQKNISVLAPRKADSSLHKVAPDCTLPGSLPAVQTGDRKTLSSTSLPRIQLSPVVLRSVLQTITSATGHGALISTDVSADHSSGYFPLNTPASALLFLHILRRHEGLMVTTNPRTGVVKISHQREQHPGMLPEADTKEVF
ncbi:hypothetical protein H7F10_15525 [Acidithiobacillus sp. HP-6]|uniref:hypothetical protein n=1 Tax=unclassified Acidithiobacillus TaxID=2614800 RepID=UPI0018795426|nr:MULTISPECIES: hypothetical protein [unclassified Acidithiobacillus]MBE7564305.1 hypothetical protein [Acidithiobacillus sp. HP-6]MBE7571001.1 hypothetical protein [Acidithiobacillus sp. HP-2]